MLGYQHRGIEKLLKKSPTVQLAESICGDSTIAHSLAFAKSIESYKSPNFVINLFIKYTIRTL